MRPIPTGFLCLVALSLPGLTLPVRAQAPAPVLPNLPAESVTVTVTKPSETAIRDFIATRAAPAHVTDVALGHDVHDLVHLHLVVELLGQEDGLLLATAPRRAPAMLPAE